jgi:hypothetical protein
MTVAFTISALLLGIIGAVAAGTGTVTPPPKIAFVTTNANVAPDALTVGPMAGRLGAPLFITNKDSLGDDVKTALVAYDAELIIVAGGPNTVTDGVLAQISAATGLAIKDIADTPADGIVRVFGSGRDQTAVALSELIAAYNPKFLPTDATAADSDLLDGKDSTEFLGATAKAADSEKLDGMDSSAFFPVVTRLHYTGGRNDDGTVGFTYEKIFDVGTFAKVHAGSDVEIAWSDSGEMIGSAGNFCHWQIRVDDLTDTGRSDISYSGVDGGNAVAYATAATSYDVLFTKAVFSGLTAGNHTVSIWLRGDATSCDLNNGSFGHDVIVTELPKAA